MVQLGDKLAERLPLAMYDPRHPSYHPLQLGEKLAEHLPSLWDGQQLQLLLPCVPAPEALCTLLLGSLEQLAEVLHAHALSLPRTPTDWRRRQRGRPG